MINLLDLKTRRELLAARQNIVIIRYVIILTILCILIVLSYGVGYFLLDSQENAYKNEIAQVAPKKEQYKQVIELANQFNKDLAIAKNIIDNQVNFSSLMIYLDSLKPPGSVMSSISLKAADMNKELTFNFRVISPLDVVKIKTSFEESPYFSDVKIRLIDEDKNSPPYQYDCSVFAVFNRKQFVNDFKDAR